MKKRWMTVWSAALLLIGSAVVSAAPRLVFEAEESALTADRAEIVPLPDGGRGVALKPEVKAGSGAAAADLVFTLEIPTAGKYEIFSTASASDAVFRRISIALDEEPVRSRAVIYPWRNLKSCKLQLMRAELTAGTHRLAIRLPEKVALDRLEFALEKLPPVPAAAASYVPPILPPAVHPRLLVSPETLPTVRRNLVRGENAAIWEKLREKARESYQPKFDPEAEVGFDEKLLDLATFKAFVALVENAPEPGREALKLICDYLPRVEMDNQLDNCRRIGQIIYSAALVYDWCYPLASPEQKALIREHLMRLSESMEIGWPPFKQPVINGHGNEAQLSRDLLAMAIAIYDEDPVPYRLCSYRLLEEVVPAHDYEYRSGRHNQGGSYGPYRFGWDLYSAWIFLRMSGKKVFSPDIEKVSYFWMYLRTPDGSMFFDGDDTNGQYPVQTFSLFLSYTYAADPLLKAEFLREKGMDFARHSPLLFLLLNDPALEPASPEALTALPLTRYFGDPLGSMICRTGWKFNRFSAEAAVELKGAGVQFYNHQHLDSGGFQIYYRGMLATDLGRYLYYGTPYDMNFNKRSIAHNVMLAYDPEEKLPPATFNDGGQLVTGDFHFFSAPASMAELTSKTFRHGSVLAAGFGPDPVAPFYSFLKADLAPAYGPKLTAYVRSFCFWNLGRPGCPAALIVFDRMVAARPDIRKFWLLNSYGKPEIGRDRISVVNRRYGVGGRLTAHVLLPKSDNLNITTAGGEAAHNVFGLQYVSPYPDSAEAKGWRSMVSPKQSAAEDVFLTALVIGDEAAELPAAELIEGENWVGAVVNDRVVLFARSGGRLASELLLDLPPDEKEFQLLVADLAPGVWTVRTRDDGGRALYQTTVDAESGRLFAMLPPGRYVIRPGAEPGVPALPAYAGIRAQASPDNIDPAGKTFLNRREVEDRPFRKVDGVVLVPVEKLFRAAGMAVEATAAKLTVSRGPYECVFTAGSPVGRLDGFELAMPAKPLIADGVWHLPVYVAGGVIGGEAVVIEDDRSVWFDALPADRCPIVKVEASHGATQQEELFMLFNEQRNRGYWAANSREAWLKIYLAEPRVIEGINITWFRGGSRQFSFAVETSLDGERWEPAFEGRGSGRDDAMATYRFTSRRRARIVRFRGFGSNQNEWNSIHNLSLIPGKP
jgi:heparin/heparan-sulfate lyase